MSGQRYVAVIGPSEATAGEAQCAESVGRLLAERGAVVVCGGLGGVMEAASGGAASVGGTVLGILPGTDRADANEHVTVVPSRRGWARCAMRSSCVPPMR